MNAIDNKKDADPLQEKHLFILTKIIKYNTILIFL